jgi:hypothetical protein
MADSKRALILAAILCGGFFFGGVCLLIHAWKTSHVIEITEDVQKSLSPSEIVSLIDLQIEHARQRLQDLDPGPPPPWFYPSYYYEWMPRARVYAEAQEALHALRKQKTEMVERGKTQLTQARSVWNFGISPIFHAILAFTLILAGFRAMLRFALWKGMFGWVSLEKAPSIPGINS